MLVLHGSRVAAETTVHLSIDGIKLTDHVVFNSRIDLTSLADKYKIEIQGCAIAQRSATTESVKYQPVTDLSPSIEPTEVLWIKGKKLKGEQVWFVLIIQHRCLLIDKQEAIVLAACYVAGPHWIVDALFP